MFIINIEYIAPLDEIDRLMEAHVAYLDKYYKADIFIIWGRKVPRTGGIIIGQADSLAIMKTIAKQDPFYINHAATLPLQSLTYQRRSRS